MDNMNKINICDAIKKAKKQVSSIETGKKDFEDLGNSDGIFPSETYKFANSSFFDPKILGEFQAKPILEWSKKDFLDLVKNLYFQKFISDIHIPPAYGYMYLNVIEEICSKNFPDSNIKILKAKYIYWYFQNHILKDTIKYNSKWNIRKMVAPRVVASFILHFSGNAEINDIDSHKMIRLPVNESLLDIYYRGDASEFIKCYGVIIPFAFLFLSKKLSWDDCLEYIIAGIKDLVTDRNVSEKLIKKITEQYCPYNEKFDKILPEKLLVALTSKTGINFTGVNLK
jgi:hypothetical protein